LQQLVDKFVFPPLFTEERINLSFNSSDSFSGNLESGLSFSPSTWSSHLYSRIQFFLLSWGQFGLTTAASTSSRLLCNLGPRDFILYKLWAQFPLWGLPPPWNLSELSHSGQERAKPYA
jgi:hypothetical protein